MTSVKLKETEIYNTPHNVEHKFETLVHEPCSNCACKVSVLI